MADRFPIRYEIGGELTHAVLDELIEHLIEVSLTREYGGCDDETSLFREVEKISGKEPLKICNNDLAPYMTEQLDLFLMEHRQPFVKRTDARFEYNGEIQWWRPGMKQLGRWEFTNTEATEILISLDVLKRALKKRKSLRQVIAEMELIAPNPGPITLLSRAAKAALPL